MNPRCFWIGFTVGVCWVLVAAGTFDIVRWIIGSP